MLLVQADDSLTDALRVVSVLWLQHAAASWVTLSNQSSIPKRTSCNHCLSILSATRVHSAVKTTMLVFTTLDYVKLKMNPLLMEMLQECCVHMRENLSLADLHCKNGSVTLTHIGLSKLQLHYQTMCKQVDQKKKIASL